MRCWAFNVTHAEEIVGIDDDAVASMVAQAEPLEPLVNGELARREGLMARAALGAVGEG